MSESTAPRNLLAQVPLFRDLSPRSLRRLARLCVVRDFPSGSVLIEEEGAGLGLFVLTSGTVEVTRSRPGGRLHLATLGPGDVVGELSLIDDRPRSARVTATTNTQCLLITRNGFRELVQRDPEVAWLFVPVLADRLREMQDRAVPDQPPSPDAETRRADTAVAKSPHEQEPLAENSSETAGENHGPGPRMAREAADLQYAFARAAIASVDSASAMGREFLDTLSDETGIGADQPLPDARDFASGVLKSLAAALRTGERAPETILSTLRHHLRRDAP